MHQLHERRGVHSDPEYKNSKGNHCCKLPAVDITRLMDMAFVIDLTKCDLLVHTEQINCPEQGAYDRKSACNLTVSESAGQYQ